MRHLKLMCLLASPIAAPALMLGLTAGAGGPLLGIAHAQDVRIVAPQEGQDVRGEIRATFEGVPAGGYAVVKIDGNFRQATAQDFVVFDTLSDRVTFPRGDATYKMEVTILNSGGKRVGSSTVSFNVANGKVDQAGGAVRLVHWTNQDRLDSGVQRYRVFAESNANISGGAAAGGGAMGGAAMGGAMMGGGGKGGAMMGGDGGGGGAGGASGYLASPLDWQVSALMRRVVRDVGLLNGGANIATIVQESFEHQRGEAVAGAGGADGGALGVGGAAAAPAGAAGTKAPWSQSWSPATETGKYFIKMIEQNGTEINATRKAPSIAIADLLPTFPDVPVRPGSTWETTMSFVGDLSTRTAINVRSPITFTAYENLQTASGETRRCAKLESRFRLPDNLAKRIAANLANKVGGAGGAAGGAAGGEGGAPGAAMGRGGAMAGGAAGGAAAGGLTENDIQVARTDMARVLWFDVERRRILRAEDTIRTNFEVPAQAGGAIGGAPGGFPGAMGGFPGAMGGDGAMGGAPAAPAEPQRVDYDLRVTTWLDDRIPNPTGQYVPGGAGPHTRDSVTEPGLSRVVRSTAPPRR